MINQLANNNWSPGMRVSEREIADATNASRMTIRSAVSLLVGQGLLTAGHRGVFVRKFDCKQLQALFEFRMAIEVAAVRLACLRAAETKLQELKAVLEEMEHSVEDGNLMEFTDSDYEFHLLIAEASENSHFSELVPIFRLQTVRWRNRALLLGGESKARLSEHKLITKKMMERDQDGAAEAMRVHLENTGRKFQEVSLDNFGKVKNPPQSLNGRG